MPAAKRLKLSTPAPATPAIKAQYLAHAYIQTELKLLWQPPPQLPKTSPWMMMRTMITTITVTKHLLTPSQFTCNTPFVASSCLHIVLGDYLKGSHQLLMAKPAMLCIIAKLVEQ
jgi:hypothetical protein